MNEPITKHKYQAFISYNHAADGRVAPAVQTALRRFGKAWYSPASIDVFRDETGLGLTPDLWGEIQQRLEQSQCFILLASPEAAQSQWVEKEIRHWLEHRSAGPLLIVLTGGKLSWSKEPNDFDWTQTNALPRTLQGVFPNEPLWADLSWAKTGAELSLRNPRFFGEIAKIVAGLRQKPLDEVFSEAAVQQKKARSLLWITVAVLAVLTVLAVAASTISFRSIADGRRLRAEALENQRLDDARLAAEKESRRQAVAAAALLAKDRELSARLALKALDIAPTREAEHALRQTLLGLISPLLLEGHSNVVNDAQFSVDSKRVMTTSDDGTVRVWNADTGTNLLVVRVVEDTKSGNYAAGSLSRDGTKVLTLVKPQTLAVGYWKSSSEPKLYDVATGNLIATIPDRFVVSAALSPDSLQIATAGFDTSAKIWDARTGKLRFDLRGHEHRVASVSFSSNGNWVVTASWDGTARVWEANTGRSLAVLKIPNDNKADYAAFNPDGTRVITLCDETKELSLWDWANRPGEPVAVFAGHEGSIQDFAFSADGRRLVTASGDRTARIWETATGKCLHIFSGHEEFVNGAAFSPDGRWIVTASGDQTAQIWDAATGENLMPLGWDNFPRTSAAFSPDGKKIVTGTIGGTVPVYTYDILGSADELRQLARARIGRKPTPEERKQYFPEATGK